MQSTSHIVSKTNFKIFHIIYFKKLCVKHGMRIDAGHTKCHILYTEKSALIFVGTDAQYVSYNLFLRCLKEVLCR